MTLFKSSTTARLVQLFTDGASRGNPGPSGAGSALFHPDGAPIATMFSYLGRQTNNVAEYHACLQGLILAHTLNIKHLQVLSDSQLLVEQLHGRFAVRINTLQQLHTRILSITKHFDTIQFQFIPRQQNHFADALANQAIQSRTPLNIQLLHDSLDNNLKHTIQQDYVSSFQSLGQNYNGSSDPIRITKTPDDPLPFI